jgi:D-beta-D-heptose 7-phosphate kinase/D-beta-D-heptose 1-phosphate adenosyltransferase
MNRSRCTQILSAATNTRILVVGDVMLDHFVWGRATRISPEAPVPVVDLERESFMPGGAANVAYNLSSLGGKVSIFGGVGKDTAGKTLAKLLHKEAVNVQGLIASRVCQTTVKMRIVCGQQQIVRLDREPNTLPHTREAGALLRKLEAALDRADAVIVGDYGKGVVSQRLLDHLRRGCHKRGLWLSLDPKPSHALDLRGLSLLTPNRREAFQLAGLSDTIRRADPMIDSQLHRVTARLLGKLQPAVLLLTLGELGMLLCLPGKRSLHIQTVAKEVFDVSGAGDTVIASFTLAVAAGASPEEAALISNHAAGIVVGKIGTAIVTPQELLRSF